MGRWTLLTLFITNIAACRPPAIKTVEVPASIKCTEAEGRRCFSVTKEFLLEHGRLFEENIRLKAKLKVCEERD